MLLLECLQAYKEEGIYLQNGSQYIKILWIYHPIINLKVNPNERIIEVFTLFFFIYIKKSFIYLFSLFINHPVKFVIPLNFIYLYFVTLQLQTSVQFIKLLYRRATQSSA